VTDANRTFLSGREVAFAVLALAFVAVITVAASLFVDARVEAVLNARQAAIVDSEIRYLRLVDAEEGRAALTRIIARRAALPNDDLPIHALVDAQGAYVAGDVDWPQGLITDGDWRPIQTYRRRQGAKVEGFGRAVKLADGAKVLIGRDLTAQHSVQAAIFQALVLALAALFAAAFAVGLLLNRRILRRIDAIALTARRISAGNLAERMPLSGQDNEFERLSGVLNAMLDRNETHIEQMRIVTEAIAHDLRLPLQRVKANLERAQSSADDAARAQAFVRADREMDEALATFNALLEITRAQSGIGAEDFETIALAPIVTDVVELFGPVAEDKKQTLLAELQDANIKGQATLLRQALGNLVQNAIKFSPEGASIRVRIEPRERTARLIVEDSGPGIPASDYATALRPFGRLARDQAESGKGLGLALVAACSKLHNGTLGLEPANPGLRVILEFPRA